MPLTKRKTPPSVLPTRSSPGEQPSAASTSTPFPSTVDSSKPAFKVGLLLPFSGPLAFLGEGYKMGIDLALKENNGVISGIPVEIISADTDGTPNGTIAAAKGLMQQSKVNLMIGPGTSPEALAALPIINEGQIPTIDATSTNPLLFAKAGIGGNPWYFRINADEHILAQAFSSTITRNISSIAIISEDDDFSRMVAAEYVNLFKNAGLNITREEYTPATTTEYRPLLLQIRQGRPDALFLVLKENTCAILLRQYKNSYTTIPVFSRGACATNLFNQIVQDDPQIGENITEAVIFSELQDAPLARNFEKAVGQPLTGHRMAGYYAMKYVVIPAFQSLIQSGNTVTPENLQKAIAGIQVDTPLGRL
ncbi:MAG TPA: ABC transporter substrate-binding protein, partial [Leptolinea sp.]